MTEQQKNQVSVIQKDITDSVNTSITRLQDEGLVIPSNYNYSNALKSAFFALQTVKTGKDDGYKLALEACTKESIANSLLDMVTQGLNPAKTQCYFVIYKDFGKGTFELQMQRSYFGTQTVIKRLSEVKDIWANVIYQDDVFEYANVKGRETLISHETKFENRDKPIIGAYAIVETAEGEQLLTPMTKKEIDASWSQAKTKNVQQKFPQEMAKRTVINRAAKAFINTSNDSDLLVESINRTTANEYEDNEIKQVDPLEETQEEIKQNANKQVIDFEETPSIPESTEVPGRKIINQEEQQGELFTNLSDVTEEPQRRKRDF
ncbi:recombinase RecT [Vagococcus fluvialis]|uniref:recombinase RecT n=1 Tax=Vagococcus fluvialis TaxID=2738 RepID=UPI003B221AC9